MYVYALTPDCRGEQMSAQGAGQHQPASPRSPGGTDLITSADFKQMRSNSTPRSGGKSRLNKVSGVQSALQRKHRLSLI